ncbi:MAG: SRPBCC domain-containing protein [Acidobacteria bacterium]|nr:SRPBCC domain-containing protein [Acidobacteriota bacterium]
MSRRSTTVSLEASSQGTSLTITRVLKASQQAVWDAWSKPHDLCQWMGPAAIERCEALAFDLREGGGFRFRMHTASGEQPVVAGVFRRVAVPTELAFSWAWEGDDGPSSLVTVELDWVPEGVRMTLTHRDFPTSDARDRHLDGWHGSFDKLDGFLVSQ